MCVSGCTVQTCTVEPANKGLFGDDIYSADLFFVERFSSLGGSKCTVGIILGPKVVLFVERLVILCPYLEESTIGGSTVYKTSTCTSKRSTCTIGIPQLTALSR